MDNAKLQRLEKKFQRLLQERELAISQGKQTRASQLSNEGTRIGVQIKQERDKMFAPTLDGLRSWLSYLQYHDVTSYIHADSENRFSLPQWIFNKLMTEQEQQSAVINKAFQVAEIPGELRTAFEEFGFGDAAIKVTKEWNMTRGLETNTPRITYKVEFSRKKTEATE